MSNTTPEQQKPALFEFGFIGSYPPGTIFTPGEKPSCQPTTGNTFNLLKDMAMPEKWDYSRTPNKGPLPILYNYVIHTFARLKEQERIVMTDSHACFNTGLVTQYQEEIYMLFRKSRQGNWAFSEFCKESSNSLGRFTVLPERATYFTDYSELIYDPNLSLLVNADHIIDDADNFARFPSHIQKLPKHQLVNTLQGAIEHAKKRVKRNYLTAIPQFYRGKYAPEPQLQLLLPLCLTDPSKADLALAVRKNNNSYSGRTCLTLDMAINNARLITKPDDEWLIA